VPEHVIADLLGSGVRRRVAPRSVVFTEGDEPTAVYLLESGLVRIDRTLRTGRCVLLTLTLPGQVFGELALIDGAPHAATATSVSDSRIVRIPASAFVAALEASPALVMAVLRRVTANLRTLTDQFVEATSYGASARVAARLVSLLDMADPSSSGPVELRLPITQEDLAQWAGLSREGVVKGLSELRSASILETGRRRITILDPLALRASATVATPASDASH